MSGCPELPPKNPLAIEKTTNNVNPFDIQLRTLVPKLFYLYILSLTFY
jgi:hypothetical protein